MLLLSSNLGLPLGGFHEDLGVEDAHSLKEGIGSFLKYHLSLIHLAKSSNLSLTLVR